MSVRAFVKKQRVIENITPDSFLLPSINCAGNSQEHSNETPQKDPAVFQPGPTCVWAFRMRRTVSEPIQCDSRLLFLRLRTH